jgi:hypothetical protein
MNYNPSTIDRVADINAGLKVVKSASSCAATADVSLFTVTGGKIWLLGLIGECDSAMEAAATTILIKCVPSLGGTATPLSVASSSLSAKAQDTMLTLPAAVGSALTISTGEGAAVATAAPAYLVQPGTIKMTVGAATNTGTITWTLWYVPAEDGAYLTAA